MLYLEEVVDQAADCEAIGTVAGSGLDSGEGIQGPC